MGIVGCIVLPLYKWCGVKKLTLDPLQGVELHCVMCHIKQEPHAILQVNMISTDCVRSCFDI